MAGEIKHEWNGTVLTITSDSGTSSADLKGKKGDTGIRGPQGRAGVILKDDGSVDMNGYATEAYVLDAIEIALEDYTPSGGGGGGGGGGTTTNNAKLTLKSTTGWTYKTIADSGECVISGEWSSIEDDMPTGSGTLTLIVGSSIKLNKNIPQGPFSLPIEQYLNSGSNTVQIKITDIYGNSSKIAFTVNKLSLTITSTFDATIPYSASISYTYTPTGNATKLVHFLVDGVEIGTQEVTTSGRQQTYTIAKKSHGSHSFEVYFTVDLEGETVESNHLYYDLMFITAGTTTPIISCAYHNTDVTQFETIAIEYIVYSPSSYTSDIVLKVDGEVVSEINVDRKKQIWSYRVDSAGEVILSIECGGISKTIKLNVAESPIDVKPTIDNLELYLTSYGRSNNEANPAKWEFDNIACTFDNYNWISDGWQLDEDGITVHRVSGDGRLTIPFKIFASDFRTTGKTLEFEFRTRDVQDYDTEIVNCYSGGIGFKMTAQQAMMQSEQSSIGTQYKEDEHIRLSFVVEKKAETRLLLVYINGIICGAVQYPTDDDFSQKNAVDITIGSNLCTTDIYCIRIYNNNLNHYQILDNWIYDTQDLALKAERYARNNVFDAYGEIVIDNLPTNLPYLILKGPTLPQFKGNKLSMDGEFVDPINPSRSFKFAMAECDVQGTSSAGYSRKNYKIKFLNGINQNGVIKEKYQMRNSSIPSAVFCMKADVASSEGCNNVELAKQYNDVCPYKTPPQSVNPSIRQGIDGFPIVIFHDNGEEVKFIGKYNFNDEKSAHDVYGFTSGDESWELKNNTSDRVNWKSADFTGDDWKNDFEARYPEDNENTNNLRRFAEWVVSTDRAQATNATFETARVVNGVSYTKDDANYRLAKFKYEIHQYCELESAIFFYLFTELYLLIDNRSKNTFPSLISGSKICWLPYDMDSAMGISNTGDLVFGFGLEDTDILPSGATPYNGQDNVFWCNIRDAFPDEIRTMYQKLRSDNKISYDITEKAFRDHQGVWCEAVWNMDAWYKYILPLIEDGAGIYLPMLQGSKAEQRKWWLYNRYRYIDSKYNAGDAQKDFITLRGYAKGDITLEPYADIYTTIKYGSYLVQQRSLKGNQYTLACPLSTVNDTEIYIYSAPQLKSVGDLSALKVGLADFSKATRLQNIKIGDSASTYSNGNLKSLTLGNNVLLKTIDVRNCSALGTDEQQSVDLSGCVNLEEAYFSGTSIKGLTLCEGGILKKLHLPGTITNLTIIDHIGLEEFVMNDYSNITTLRLENISTDVVPAYDIVRSMPSGGRVRLIDVDWNLGKTELCEAVMTKLATMRGLDENGNNVDEVQISGKIAVPYMTSDIVPVWQEMYPNVEFTILPFSLEGCTWAEVAEVVAAGEHTNLFKVGEEKSFKLTTGEEVIAIILGFNHDTLSDGTGKAAITFGFKNCLEASYQINRVYSSLSSNDSDYLDSSMYRTYLPNIYNTLPQELKDIIKNVKKSIYRGGASGYTVKDVNFFLPSHFEIMGTIYESYYDGMDPTVADSEEDHTNNSNTSMPDVQYEYFAKAPIPSGFTGLFGDTGTFYSLTSGASFTSDIGTKIVIGSKRFGNYNAGKVKLSDPTAYKYYWTSSPVYDDSGEGYNYYTKTNYAEITSGEYAQFYVQSDNELGVAPAFCI